MLNGTYTDPNDPINHSILYYVNRNNPLGPAPDNPNSEPQFKNWEWTISNYFSYQHPTPLPPELLP